VTIEASISAPASIYAINDDFGDPTPANTLNPLDFLIHRTQYTISYNQSRGTPNWVSYELDARQIVAGQDRCNCFSADPLLPPAKQIFTSDYTNGGFDRGHMTRSADRTAGNVDNAITFYLSNVVPQTADLNEGVWAQFEDALADSTAAGRAVYIITGPLFSRSHGLTFLKSEGKVAIPDSTWKIALIGPANSGNPFTHNNVQNWSDLAGLSLLAVNMPNIAGVRNDPWAKYLTTVDSIEAATGYSFLSALPPGFRSALQYHDHAPVATFAVSGSAIAGSPMTFDASTSTDPDLGRTDLGGRTEGLTYSWRFSDGTTAAGKSATKSFAASGSYTATLTVTDVFGWPSTSASTVVVTSRTQAAIAGLDAITVQVNALAASGSIVRLTQAAFKVTIDAARLEVSKGHTTAAIVLLRGLNDEIKLTLDLRRMSAADAAALKAQVNGVIGLLDIP
jgi:endonuclease G